MAKYFALPISFFCLYSFAVDTTNSGRGARLSNNVIDCRESARFSEFNPTCMKARKKSEAQPIRAENKASRVGANMSLVEHYSSVALKKLKIHIAEAAAKNGSKVDFGTLIGNRDDLSLLYKTLTDADKTSAYNFYLYQLRTDRNIDFVTIPTATEAAARAFESGKPSLNFEEVLEKVRPKGLDASRSKDGVRAPSEGRPAAELPEGFEPLKEVEAFSPPKFPDPVNPVGQ